jgi:Outer membrane lipoprotein-sorting protein
MNRLPLALLALALPTVAHADPEGEKALAALDVTLNRAESHYFEYEAVTEEPGRAPKKLGLQVHMKGPKRLTQFTAPADLKGTKVLALSPTEMYVWLPAFGKVRRIASHTTDQSAFGMTFTQDDFAAQKYAPDYTGQLVSQDEKQLKLTLLPRAGGHARYGKLELTILKEGGVPSELKYFGDGGKLLKTETRSGYTCEADVCTPGELKMVDHGKGGMTTTITRKAWKLNQKLSDDLFSKRNLEK